MNLPEHFETFFGRISVDDARLNRVRKAHMAMSRALRQDGYIDRAMFETFLQGSCAHGTLVRPLGKGTEFDIDVCCLLDLGPSANPIQGAQTGRPLACETNKKNRSVSWQGEEPTPLRPS